MSTLNRADLGYGPAQSAIGAPDVPTQVRGPNQGSVASGMDQGQAMAAGRGPAFTWLGFALALVALRIAIELGGDA